MVSCTDTYGEVFTVAAAAAEERTHSPGLRLPPGHALSRPLGVRGQVINQLAADLVGGLVRVSLLQHTGKGRMMDGEHKSGSCDKSKTKSGCS